MLFTKSFLSFLRDYGSPESGVAEIIDAVLPVVVIDDVSEYVERTPPIYAGRDIMAATAAVYAMVGLHATTQPIRIRALELSGQPATANVHLIIGLTDLRTANQSDGTAAIPTWPRGELAPTAEVLAGTTTVAPGVGAYLLWSATDSRYMDTLPVAGLVLRPGEYAWTEANIVNESLQMNLAWEESLFPLPANTPNLG